MYKVGIIGHKFENMENIDKSNSEMEKILDLLVYQYDNNILFNLGGERGLELLAGNYCIRKQIKYHLFLPCNPNVFADGSWYDYQKENLDNQFKNAFSVTICSPSSVNRNLDTENQRYDLLIDNSNFIVSFWTGKKIGGNYNNIKNALKKNKIVLNGLNDLKLITNNDLGK